MNTAASRLRSARTAAGYTSARQAALSHNMSISTYTAHENGQNDYSAEKAEEYAKAFKTKAAWLLLGSNDDDDLAISIDSRLKRLPPDVSRKLIQRFNDMLDGAESLGKVK